MNKRVLVISLKNDRGGAIKHTFVRTTAGGPVHVRIPRTLKGMVETYEYVRGNSLPMKQYVTEYCTYSLHSHIPT